MGNLVINQAAKFLRERRNTRRWIAVVLCLALVVTSGTFGALTRQGHALSDTNRQLACAYTPHQHGEGCYNEAGELVCGYADYCVHTHNESCYDSEGALVCQLPEIAAHVHDESCYATAQTLVCGLEESEGHRHTDSCYTIRQGEQICGKEEHTHGEGCYTVSGGDAELSCGLEEHSHTDECFSWNSVLTCTEEEGAGAHTHNESCYSSSVSGNDLSVSGNDAVLICGLPELHTHDDSCYAPDDAAHINPICGKIVLEEHIHNEDCFAYKGFELTAGAEGVTLTVSVDEEGILPENAQVSVTPIVKQETPEGETAATDNTAYDQILAGLQATLAEDTAKEVVHFLAYEIRFTVENENGETEQIQPEGPVDLTMEFTGAALPQEIAEKESIQIAGVNFAELKADEAGFTAEIRQDASLETIGKNQVQKAEATLTESGIVAVSWVGELNKYYYEDDQVIITVSAAEEGIIPKNARLRVIPITASEETGEQYAQVAEKLLEKAENEEYDIAGFLAYDIAFVDEEGNEVEPNGEVKVTMDYKQAVIPEELNQANYALLDETDEATTETEATEEQVMNIGVTVMHLEEDENGQVAQVVDLGAENKVETLETTEEQAVEKTEFVTDGFSVYTVTWTWDTSKPFVYEDDEVKITVTAVSEGAIPEGSKISVTPIRAENEETAAEYQKVVQKLIEKVENENCDIAGFLSYDISLIDGDGNEIEPEGRVKVTMEYKKAVTPANLTAEAAAIAESAEIAETQPEAEATDDAQAETAESVESTETVSEEEAQSEEVQSEEVVSVEAQPEEVVSEETKPEATIEGENAEAQPETTDEQSEEAETSDVSSTITISFDEEGDQEENGPDITVMHLEEDEAGEVTQVVDLAESGNVQLDAGEGKELKVEFETESFSTFTIIWKPNRYSTNLNIVFRTENGNEINVPQNVTNSVEEILKNNLSKDTYFEMNSVSDNPELNQFVADKCSYEFKGMTQSKSSNQYDQYEINGLKIKYSSDYDGMYIVQYNDSNNWEDLNGAWSYDNYSYEWNYTVYIVYSATMKTVETLDNNDYGISIKMRDMTLSDQNKLFGDVGYWWNGSGLNDDGTSNGDKRGVTKGGVENRLGADGYPVVIPREKADTTRGSKFASSYDKTKQSLKNLFEGGTEANHLFLESIYKDTGYFEYSAFENYAYLKADGNFTVYEAIGTPRGTNAEDLPFMQRGNFFPYNNIVAGAFATDGHNLYGENGVKLSDSDKRYDERLYQAQGTINFNFGMELTVSFTQPQDGKVTAPNGSIENMRYEFTGDDDLWVFIDDVLVLDIGGNHDSRSGYIDFATGEVGVQKGSGSSYNTTTIKQAFQDAGVESELLFTGNTFKNYTTHTLKMFYLERGKDDQNNIQNASNLHVKMNLATIPSGVVEVEKQLSNTDKEKYKDVKFAYQVLAQKATEIGADGNIVYSDEEYVALDKPFYKGTTNPIAVSGATIDGKYYENVFYLKPGETAQFVSPEEKPEKNANGTLPANIQEYMQANRKYRVLELGVSSQEYDKVVINSQEITVTDAEGKVTSVIDSLPAEVGNRPHVTYINNCSAANSRELRITKALAEGQELLNETDTFTFKVVFIKESGEGNSTGAERIPYDGDYYLQDKDGNYFYYQTAKDGKETLVSNGENAIVSGKKAIDGKIAGVPAEYTVVLTKIMSGTKFEVEEVDIPTGYEVQEIEVNADYKDYTEVSEVVTGTIQLKKDAEIKVVNGVKQLYKWQLVKKSSSTDASSTNVFLAGAKFELTKMAKDANGAWTVPTGSVKYYGRSGVDGTAATTVDQGIVVWYKSADYSAESKLGTIPAGTYRLKETEAPSGYGLSAEEWLITIEQDGRVTVQVGQEAGTWSDPKTADVKETIKDNTSDTDSTGSEATAGDEITKYTFYFENDPVYALPSAGGEGIYWYSIGGTLLMLAGALILYRNKKRKRRYRRA